MPRGKDSLRIEVEESTAGDVRTVTVAVTAPAKDFLLPDLLESRGAVRSYEVTLKQAVRETTEGYLAAAEGLIAGIATGQKQTDKAEPAVPGSKRNADGKGTNSTSSKPKNAVTEKATTSAEAGPTTPPIPSSTIGD